MEETFRAKLVSILKSWCMGLYQMMACCCCCKLLKVQSFRRVPTCTASHRGVPAEAVEAVAAVALPAIPTWKPPNWEEKSQMQTAQSTKLQKSSYMYRFSSFSQGGPCWGCWGRYLPENPHILKKRAKTIQNRWNYSKTIYDIDFVVPENLKKEESWRPYYITYSDYNGMSQCWIYAFI